MLEYFRFLQNWSKENTPSPPPKKRATILWTWQPLAMWIDGHRQQMICAMCTTQMLGTAKISHSKKHLNTALRDKTPLHKALIQPWLLASSGHYFWLPTTRTKKTISLPPTRCKRGRMAEAKQTDLKGLSASLRANKNTDV